MPEALKLVDASHASDYLFTVTRSEPNVTYWQPQEEQVRGGIEVNVPRAKRRLLKGLTVPVREMLTIDFIPAQVHVNPQDIVSGLESLGEVSERDLAYWRSLVEHLSGQDDTLVTFGAGGGELRLATLGSSPSA